MKAKAESELGQANAVNHSTGAVSGFHFFVVFFPDWGGEGSIMGPGCFVSQAKKLQQNL